MADGKHCPACSQDVGYRPVALQIFWIRCPHCRTRLTYVARNGVLLVNVIGCGIPAAFVGMAVADERKDVADGILAGTAVLVVLGMIAGGMVQMALAPSMRRTRTLKLWGKTTTPSEDSW